MDRFTEISTYKKEAFIPEWKEEMAIEFVALEAK